MSPHDWPTDEELGLLAEIEGPAAETCPFCGEDECGCLEDDPPSGTDPSAAGVTGAGRVR